MVLPVLGLQQDGPVQAGPHLRAHVRVVPGAVVVLHTLRLQGQVHAQVLHPEAHHEVPGQDGHLLVLQVGRRVEIQGLQHRVDQGLDAEFHPHGVVGGNLERGVKTPSASRPARVFLAGDSHLLGDGGGQVSSSAVAGDADTLGVDGVSGEDVPGQEVLRGSQAVQVLNGEVHLRVQAIPTDNGGTHGSSGSHEAQK